MFNDPRHRRAGLISSPSTCCASTARASAICRCLSANADSPASVSDPHRLHYLPHVERRGTDLFAKACALNLDDIIIKWRHAPYGTSENQINTFRLSRLHSVDANFAAAQPRVEAAHFAHREHSDRSIMNSQIRRICARPPVISIAIYNVIHYNSK